jgi:hypothetical protein
MVRSLASSSSRGVSNACVSASWLLGAVMVCMLSAAMGCGDGSSPTVTAGAAAESAAAGKSGSGQSGSGQASAGQSAQPAATFTAVYEMMFPMTTNARCNACHANPANDIANGKLQMGMDKASAYAALIGQTSMSSRCMNRPLLVPHQPDMSLFFQKLSATPPCGTRMPNGGNPFTGEQLEMVRSWIAAGAKDD